MLSIVRWSPDNVDEMEGGKGDVISLNESVFPTTVIQGSALLDDSSKEAEVPQENSDSRIPQNRAMAVKAV